MMLYTEGAKVSHIGKRVLRCYFEKKLGIMDYNKKLFSRQYPIVAFFVRHLAYARGLKAAMDNLTDHREFWESTVSAYLELATVAWCKVFGSNNEQTHWKKTLTDNIEKQTREEEQACEDFHRRILS